MLWLCDKKNTHIQQNPDAYRNENGQVRVVKYMVDISDDNQIIRSQHTMSQANINTQTLVQYNSTMMINLMIRMLLLSRAVLSHSIQFNSIRFNFVRNSLC